LREGFTLVKSIRVMNNVGQSKIIGPSSDPCSNLDMDFFIADVDTAVPRGNLEKIEKALTGEKKDEEET